MDKENSFDEQNDDTKDLLELLIRKIYHDGMNLCGSLKEIIPLKFDGDTATYLSSHFGYYLSLLKNMRFFYLVQKDIDFFAVEKFKLVQPLEQIFSDSCFLGEGCFYGLDTNVMLQTRKELFYILILNLVNNAYRFGKDVAIFLAEEDRLVIKNDLCSSFVNILSIYDFPVMPDKHGITGAGVGLYLVKKLVNILNIELSSQVSSQEVRVFLDLKAVRI
ncbi:MAG: ATP-binding protein [Desulfonauticus sp.]|nr:ATP-binding protein [Desulfonauticus sp.]